VTGGRLRKSVGSVYRQLPEMRQTIHQRLEHLERANALLQAQRLSENAGRPAREILAERIVEILKRRNGEVTQVIDPTAVARLREELRARAHGQT